MSGVAWELGTQFGMAGKEFAMADILWINGRSYQINMYNIDINNPWIEVLERDVYEHEEDCECCGPK